MPQVTIQAGAKVWIPGHDDIRKAAGEASLEAARGVKWMRLPLMSGTIASNAITLGIGSGQTPVGPESGYLWFITRLVVTGLTTGTTPDLVNLYRSDAFAGPPLWQFNGNNFAYTFRKGQLTLMSGETLSLKNSGSIAATGTVTLSGELIEVPAERAGLIL